jgi:hypothetical protein
MPPRGSAASRRHAPRAGARANGTETLARGGGANQGGDPVPGMASIPE